MYEVESLLNPAIFRSHTSGKTYIVAGDQPWIEVPEGTTLNDVRWIRAPQPETDPVDVQEQIFKVEGSKGNKYTVKRAQNDSWSCECVGYGYRQRCKHIEKIKEKIA